MATIPMNTIIEEKAPAMRPKISDLEKGACFSTGDSIRSGMTVFRIPESYLVADENEDPDDVQDLNALVSIGIADEVLVLNMLTGEMELLSLTRRVLVIDVELKVKPVANEDVKNYMKAKPNKISLD